MTKNEVCEQIAAICNSLNEVTVTGVKNAAIISSAHSSLVEVLSFLMRRDLVLPEEKRDENESGGE